jgi:hypothetical protein
MSSITKKMFYNEETGQWEVSIDQNDSDLEAYLNSLEYDGDLSGLLADRGTTDTEEQAADKVSNSILSSVSYQRPILKSESSRYQTKQELIEDLVQDLILTQQEYNRKVTLADELNSEVFANLPTIVNTSVKPGVKFFTTPNMSTVRNSFEDAENSLLSSIQGIKALGMFSNPEYSPLAVKVVRVSKPRSYLDNSVVYPGDLIRLLTTGGVGSITHSNSSGISKLNPLLDIFKIVSSAAGQVNHSVSDSAGNNVTVNINITLPTNYSQSGSEEDI